MRATERQRQRIVKQRNFSAPNDLFIFICSYAESGHTQIEIHIHHVDLHTNFLTFVRHVFCHPPKPHQ